MHAVQLVGHASLKKLCYKDDAEFPRSGEDNVLIRVRAAGANNTDINTRIGWYFKSASSDNNSSSREGLKSTSTSTSTKYASCTCVSKEYKVLICVDIL